MADATFDTLEYARKLESVGFSREQADTQAEAFRAFTESQNEKLRQNLASKGDIAQLDARIRELELRLPKEMRESEMRLLKWQIGGWIALAAIMAKGFNWIGF